MIKATVHHRVLQGSRWVTDHITPQTINDADHKQITETKHADAKRWTRRSLDDLKFIDKLVLNYGNRELIYTFEKL